MAAITGGEARLNDRPLAEWESKAFARKMAYLPQQLPAAESMPVRELVAVATPLTGTHSVVAVEWLPAELFFVSALCLSVADVVSYRQ